MYTSIVYYCIYRKNQNILLQNINEKIISENDSLINDLDWKNKNITQIRTFLNDLSFKNSHDLRGPLSRILGLLNLYYSDSPIDNKELYVEYISKSAHEMDQIIRSITEEINNRNV